MENIYKESDRRELSNAKIGATLMQLALIIAAITANTYAIAWLNKVIETTDSGWLYIVFAVTVCMVIAIDFGLLLSLLFIDPVGSTKAAHAYRNLAFQHMQEVESFEMASDGRTMTIQLVGATVPLKHKILEAVRPNYTEKFTVYYLRTSASTFTLQFIGGKEDRPLNLEQSFTIV